MNWAARMRGRPVVLGYTFTGFEGKRQEEVLPAPVLPQGTFAGKIINFASFPSYTANLAELQKPWRAPGTSVSTRTPTVFCAAMPMLAEFNGAYYERYRLRSCA